MPEKKEQPEKYLPESFWRKLEKARFKVLLLDYDGTLAPFRKQRLLAKPVFGVIPILKNLSRRDDHFIAIISGRKIAELKKLLCGLNVVLVGEHGWTKWEPKRGITAHPDLNRFRPALSRLKNSLKKKIPSSQLEIKKSSVAVHTRGLEPKKAKELERIAIEEGKKYEKYGLKIKPFNKGIEIIAQGMDKGKAVMELISQVPEGAFIVYIGDDRTDEDVFRAIRGRGIGIKVRKPKEKTFAKFWLPNCKSVLKLLKEWQRVVG